MRKRFLASALAAVTLAMALAVYGVSVRAFDDDDDNVTALRALWHLDEITPLASPLAFLLRDSTINGNTGNLLPASPAPTLVPGKFGNGVGTTATSFVEVGHDPTI